MTRKLYHDDSHLFSWETTISKIIPAEEGYLTILEETAFYPGGGGQPHDIGSINGIEVLDVTISDSGRILHRMKERPAEGLCHCRIDRERRMDHTQQHSGQHLLSAVFRELYGAATESFHLGRETSSIDISASITPEQVEAAERKANHYIQENRQVSAYYVTEEQLAALPVVKKPSVNGQVRIVEIEGIEYNPCGGTHVSRTAEIGILKIIKTEKHKDFTRITFICGLRAYQDYRMNADIVSAAAAHFNTSPSEVAARFQRAGREYSMLQKENERLRHSLYALEADQLLKEKMPPLIQVIFEERPFKEVTELAAAVKSKAACGILFASRTDLKILLTHNLDGGPHCGQIVKEHLADSSGRGGGSPSSAQAGFTSSREFDLFLEKTAHDFLSRLAD